MLPPHARPRARLVLWSLLIAFVVSRVLSILIMLHKMPDIYLHVRGTHVHHLNYGIFLLAGVGAYLLFRPGPAAPPAAATIVYGIGLGLTFDEFGMWLHLNGDYWQRASFDAVIVLTVALGLAGFALPPRCSSFFCWWARFAWPRRCSPACSGGGVERESNPIPDGRTPPSWQASLRSEY